jgi:hypothetical protein
MKVAEWLREHWLCQLWRCGSSSRPQGRTQRSVASSALSAELSTVSTCWVHLAVKPRPCRFQGGLHHWSGVRDWSFLHNAAFFKWMVFALTSTWVGWDFGRWTLQSKALLHNFALISSHFSQISPLYPWLHLNVCITENPTLTYWRVYNIESSWNPRKHTSPPILFFMPFRKILYHCLYSSYSFSSYY